MKIPKQPEVNIGTAGHVDHGKCLTLDQSAYVNGSFYKGIEIFKEIIGYDFKLNYNELLFNSPVLSVSLNQRSLIKSYGYAYLQKYNGKINVVKTETGRSISVTPIHKLLVKGYGWKQASSINAGESIIVYEKNKIVEDKVTEIKESNYEGYLFDLSVPLYHNFISTDGIISHNTTLVEAITGKWTSMHSEELKRGITIKIGYADAAIYECPELPEPERFNTEGNCPRGDVKLRRVISFIDSPGHESLMSVMLSGAALMDGSLLVIAANEPVPQPQTREHLQALKMIGIKNIVVVQNKVDLVTYNQALNNYNKIVEFLNSFGYDQVPIIPVSAQKKLNIDALLQAIEEYIPTPQRNPNAPALMQVLRSFDINKPGTRISDLKGGVLGGSLKQGKLRIGDKIEIKPGIPVKSSYQPIITEVVSLAASSGQVEEVLPGGLIAIGTKLDPIFTKNDIMVGNYVAQVGYLPDPVNEIVIKYELFEYVIGLKEMVRYEKIKQGENIRLNIGTMTNLGVVEEVTKDMMRIRLRRPAVTLRGDRVAISRMVADRWRLAGSGTII
ncbi:MAG: translation initiation factor IF-2 subunit gamma [Nitrososphaeria archaeon]|nr:translation initiation factor IF-2 subunit gamma [Conexivisphaerales archaeon]